MALRRAIGIGGMTLIGVGGVIGSGWLFAPMLAAQQAGPAAIVSWVIAGVAILLLALSFAEVCSRLPVPGGLGRIPYLTHGRITAAAMGWSAWIGYVAISTVEVTVMLDYLSGPLPWLAHGSDLSLAGKLCGVVLLTLMTLLNALGVTFLIRFNSSLTYVKMVLPLVVAGTVIVERFSMANFTDHGGFAPLGWDGSLAAIATGGVVFAYLGFRHVIDMAGEARRPEVTVPVALVLSVLACVVLYIVLQVAFIGALTEKDLAGGWAALSLGHTLGPFGAIAAAIGFVWLNIVVFSGAVISPFGAALVSAGSNARLSMALAHNGFFPAAITRLSLRHVPGNALALNLAVCQALFLLLPFKELVALTGAALTVSLAVGPLSLLALRRQLPGSHGGFRLPWALPVCLLGFVVATLVVYWSGWDTVWRLGVALLVGAVLFAAMHLRRREGPLHLRESVWLLPWMGGTALLSLLGNFGGGLGLIPAGWDMAAGAMIGIAGMVLGVAMRLRDDQAAIHRAERDPFADL
mgnify:CR=1 FL=1|jgi:amino acid transporter